MKFWVFFLSSFFSFSCAMVYSGKLFTPVSALSCESPSIKEDIDLSNGVDDPLVIIRGLRKRGDWFKKNLNPPSLEPKSEDKSDSEYILHAQGLSGAYLETVSYYKRSGGLIDLLKYPDCGEFKTEKQYRIVCRVLLPFLKALNDDGFPLQEKVDALSLFQATHKDMLEKASFVFVAIGTEYDYAFNVLKLNVLHQMYLINGSQELLEKFKKDNSHIDFNQLNFLEAITNFDFIQQKKGAVVEQRESQKAKKVIFDSCFDLPQNLKEIQCLAELKTMLGQSSLLFWYFRYKAFLRRFQAEPEIQETIQYFFWHILVWKGLVQAFEQSMSLIEEKCYYMTIYILEMIFGKEFFDNNLFDNEFD